MRSSSSTASHSPGPPSSTGRLVLVVDDDPDIRAILQELLEEEGYRVAVAADGAEALQLLSHVRPHLILLDLFMPVLDGQEFRQRQLADPALATIPTVVITAADHPLERTACLQLADVITKPLKLVQLLAVVARHIDPGAAAR